MSITESDGSAAAIEYGTSMLVMRARPPSAAGSGRAPGDGDLLERRVAALGELARDRLHELLGRRRAGREADRLVAGDERRRRAATRRRSASPPRPPPARPRRGARAFELVCEPITSTSVAPSRDHRLHRVLPVLRRVTDVVRVRPPQRARALLERVDDRRDVVERQRRLRDHRDGLVGLRARAPARATRSRPSSRAARRASRSPRRGSRGRRARRDGRCRRSAAPRRAPCSRAGTSRRRRGGRASRRSPSPPARRRAPRGRRSRPPGISYSSSTKTAPSPSSRRTTCSLWTIWWRT